MKVAILCQEEPVFLGPFLTRVIKMHQERIVAVCVAGRRGAGEKKGSLQQHLTSLKVLWNIMEPRGFVGGLALRLRSMLLGELDPRSVAGFARQRKIPVYGVGNPNGEAFRELLTDIAPDIVFNQSELLLKKDVLSIPRFGFLNRHASLLPDFRGRMAGFRSHASSSPRYGITIHVVDEGVDTGPVILQQEFHDIDPAWPYPKVMKRLLEKAPEMFWKAVDLLRKPEFAPEHHSPVSKPYPFPTIGEARLYRRELARRRKHVRRQ